jgi:hypothetical protein
VIGERVEVAVIETVLLKHVMVPVAVKLTVGPAVFVMIEVVAVVIQPFPKSITDNVYTPPTVKP